MILNKINYKLFFVSLLLYAFWIINSIQVGLDLLIVLIITAMSIVVFQIRAHQIKSIPVQIFVTYYYLFYIVKNAVLTNLNLEDTLASILLTEDMLKSYSNTRIMIKVCLAVILFNVSFFLVIKDRCREIDKIENKIHSKTKNRENVKLMTLISAIIFILLLILQLKFKITAFGVERNLPFMLEGVTFLFWSWLMPIIFTYLIYANHGLTTHKYRFYCIFILASWALFDTYIRGSKGSSIIFAALLLFYLYELTKIRVLRLSPYTLIASVCLLSILFPVMGALREIRALGEESESAIFIFQLIYDRLLDQGIFENLVTAIEGSLLMAYVRFTGIDMMYQIFDVEIFPFILDLGSLFDLARNRFDFFELFYGEKGSLTVIIPGLFGYAFVIFGYAGIVFLPLILNFLNRVWIIIIKKDRTGLLLKLAFLVAWYQFISSGNVFMFASSLMLGFALSICLLYTFFVRYKV